VRLTITGFLARYAEHDVPDIISFLTKGSAPEIGVADICNIVDAKVEMVVRLSERVEDQEEEA
jgi:hypothetical protein